MGKLKVVFLLAYKSILKGNRWTLALIILVMSLSFINMLLIPSILSGLTNTMDEQQVNTTMGNIVIEPVEDEYYLSRVSAIESRVKTVSGVEGVSPRLNSAALFEYQWTDKEAVTDKGISGNWEVLGIEPDKEMSVTNIQDYIIEGRYLREGDRDEILLGIEIAGGEKAVSSSFSTLGGVRTGEKVRLTYPNGVMREYTVVGIFHSKGMMGSDHNAYITRTEMSSIMGRQVYGDRCSEIVMSIADTASEEEIISEIEALGLQGTVRSWRDYGAVSGIISSFNVIGDLISGIGLVVAGIVMFIIIYINVLSKRRQIGIMRAIGIKRDIVIGSYLVQALFFAIAGIVIGGMVMGFGVEPYFLKNPVDLPLGDVSLHIEMTTIQWSVLGMLLSAVLAGFVPVMAIIRQSIIKAIWG